MQGKIIEIQAYAKVSVILFKFEMEDVRQLFWNTGQNARILTTLAKR